MNTALVARLQSIVGAQHVLLDAADLAPYLTDWRGRYRGDALCVVRPGSTQEVAEVVRCCHDAGIAIVPQGGNTGLCGGATPRGGEVVISLTRLNRILDLDRDNNTITAQAGCILAAVQEAAVAADRLFPLSLAAEGTATIGGNLSTNAGGVHVLRYGNARELALGLEVVLPDGRIWNGLRGLRKDNTGYDLKDLFIGAEGTLGLITAAVLKLFPRPRSTATAWIALADPQAAVALLSRIRGALGDCVSAFEIIGPSSLGVVLRQFSEARDPLAGISGWRVLLELGDNRAAAGLDEDLLAVLGDAQQSGEASDAAIARNITEARAIWALRENISEAQRREGISVKHDISLPISRVAEFIARADAAISAEFPDARIVCFGHLGDGNLHYNLSCVDPERNEKFIADSAAVNRLVHDLVHVLGGSISAEHGLGQLKRDEILRYKSAVEMDIMRAVKRALDPRGLMNPGKVI